VKDKILRKLEEPKVEKQASGYLFDTAIDNYGETLLNGNISFLQ